MSHRTETPAGRRGHHRDHAVPKDAARRFAIEPDAEEWAGRLRFVGFDLHALAVIERFATSFTQQVGHLDIFVANAVQTVRRPLAYYHALVAGEREPPASLTALAREMLAPVVNSGALIAASDTTHPSTNWHAELALLPLVAGDEITGAFPQGPVAPAETLDLRAENRWGLAHEDVSTVELVEVHAVNCLAPFLLLRALRPLLRAGPPCDRFAVMVPAVGVQFASEKNGRHHTRTWRRPG